MMTDPYQVLQISPDASDDEVRRAYRELARKYHPDHYHGSPMESMAEEKMKEINEAYALIQQRRKGGGGPGGGTSGRTSRENWYGGPGPDSGGSGSAMFQQIRMAISQGDLEGAEQMLEQMRDRSAQWHYLKGVIRYYRGWLEEAAQEFEAAYHMEPDNREYQQAYQYMRSGGSAYRPAGFGSGGMMGCNWCQTMLCLGLCCTVCSRGRICLCC